MDVAQELVLGVVAVEHLVREERAGARERGRVLPVLARLRALELSIETRDAEHARTIVDAMEVAGFRVQVL